MSDPITHRPAVRRALAEAFGAAPIQSLEPISGGLSGSGVWRVRVAGGTSILKVEPPPDGLFDPHRLYACMQIAAAGPYLNARFLPQPFTGEVIDVARQQDGHYGQSDAGKGKTVVIDYSSPNIAKPIAFHHIRSTMIGNALANLYRSQGWTVQGVNYLGDWGKQFGLVAVGFQEYGDPARRSEVAHLVEVYVKANARAEKLAPPPSQLPGPVLESEVMPTSLNDAASDG